LSNNQTNQRIFKTRVMTQTHKINGKIKSISIDWEIDEYFETIDIYTKEVSLKGVDEYGCIYSASAIEICGQIEDISDIEIVTKIKYYCVCDGAGCEKCNENGIIYR